MATNNSINYPVAVSNGIATLDSGAHLTSTQFPALTGDVTTSAGALATAITNKGAANGIATLDSGGHVPTTQLSAILASLAGLAGLGIIAQTASGAVAARSIGSSDSSLTVSNGDGVLGNVDAILNLTSIKWKPVTESTTARTLGVTDVNVTISTTNASADTTITIPTNATAAIPIGGQIKVLNASAAGFVTNVVAAGGVTFAPFTSIVIGLGGYVVLEKTATNSWLILQCYEEYSHSTNWSGIWASPQTGNAYLVRNMRDIEMTIPSTLATQNTASFISMGTALPARFRPTSNTELQGPSVNNNGNTNGAGTVFSSGAVNLFATSAYVNFSGTGTGGFNRQSIDYTLT